MADFDENARVDVEILIVVSYCTGKFWSAVDRVSTSGPDKAEEGSEGPPACVLESEWLAWLVVGRGMMKQFLGIFND